MDGDELALSADALTRMALPAADDGIVVGTDGRGRPAVLTVHHPVPYEVVLLGGVWTAQIVALRAVAAGVRVMVETGRAEVWSRVLRAVDQRTGWMGCCAPGAVPPLVATVGSPVLVVRDAGGQGSPALRVPLAAPWQPVLTVAPAPGPAMPRLVRRAAVVGVQRLGEADARKVARALGLAESETAALTALPDDGTLWCAGPHRQTVRLLPTDAESGLLGPPRRADPPA